MNQSTTSIAGPSPAETNGGASPIPLGVAAFTRPSFAPSSSYWLEHIPFAHWLVEQARPRTIVELGVHTGGSYCNFCEAVANLGIDTRCFGIDNFEGDPHYISYGPEILANLKAYHDPLYREFSTLIKSDFDGALSHFEDGTIDLLHIDGTHFYEDARRDFESWKPKLSERAVVLFHDTNVHERGFGVHRLWKELTSVHRGFEFIHCHGLGVLVPGKSPAAAIDALVSADDAAAVFIRRFFSGLGDRITCIAKLSDAAERIEKLEADETILRGWVTEKEDLARAETLARLERDETIASLREDLRSALDKRNSLSARLAEAERECDSHRSEATRLRTEQSRVRNALAQLPSPRIVDLGLVAGRLHRKDPVADSGLFDRKFYLSQFPAGRRIPNPMFHYRTIGWLLGLRPNRLFDPLWYAETYHLEAGREPLLDYVTTGHKAGRRPHPLFDQEFYVTSDAGLAAYSHLPFHHFLHHGLKEGRKPCALFDPAYFAACQGDVTMEDAPDHFLKFGRRDRLNPHPLFDTGFYIEKYKEEMQPGENPLLHFMEKGRSGTFSPHPLFDSVFYSRMYPEVTAAGMNPLVHFISIGAEEGRMPNPYFETRRYRDAAMRSAPAGTNPLVHFLNCPPDQLTDPGRQFQAAWYLQTYPDVAEQKINPLVHYLTVGIKEGRETSEHGATSAKLESKYPGITRPVGIPNHDRLKQALRTPRTRVAGGPGRTRINMLFPDLDADIVFGGYISAFEFLASLAGDHDIRLVCTTQSVDASGMDGLRRKFESNPRVSKMLEAASLADISDPETILEIHPQDVFCAYSAWDSMLCNKLAAALGQAESLYFCQEDEAIFHPNDSLHALIREAQRLPQFYIFNTGILRDYFRKNRLGPFHTSDQEGMERSMAFQHALVDAKPPAAEELAARGKLKVLVYARPEEHAKRNLFEITLLGINQFLEARPELAGNLEFTGVGSMRFEGEVELAGGHTIHIQPKISYSDYAASLSRYDIGLSLMYAPHPSILPFEMASAGQVVVTNCYGSRDRDVLEGISPNLIAIDATPAGVAAGFAAALERVSDFAARVRGAAFDWSRSWERSFGPEFAERLHPAIQRIAAGPAARAGKQQDS